MSKVFVMDVSKCSGCHSCQIACKDEHCGNDWMPYAKPQPETGQFWCKVEEHVRGTMPKVKVAYYPVMCGHCENAPCIAACSNEAISRRADGLVLIDPSKCQGTMACVDACPYGVIYFNHTIRQAQKCTGCAHILDRGWPINEPRCTDACIRQALRFGDSSEFSDDIEQSEVLYPDLGLKSNAYYKHLPKKFIAGTVYDPVDEEVVIGASCTLSGDSTATVTTDDFGDFWFEDLPVGVFSLKIEATGFSTYTKDNINTEKDVNLGDIALSK
jgi:Fe-S-cluster-containing dehydrogenase component